jgi:arginyl-tRNA synthetase
MAMLGQSLRLRYLQALGIEVAFPDEGYQGEYLVEFARDLVEEHGAAWQEQAPTVFQQYAENRMFEWIRATLERVNIRHDAFFNEQTLFESGALGTTLKGLEDASAIYHAAEWEGASDEEITVAADQPPATWFRSSAFGDSKDRVLVKADGTPTYTLPDIAYHLDKIARGFDLLVNVLGADHATQYRVVQNALSALGRDPSLLQVIIVQMVRAVRTNPVTGKPEEVKMSTRRGVYDTLDALIEMTSADAIRYHLLARNPNSQLDFDVDAVIQQSNENPVYYIQNAHVRCAGIAREAEARGISDEGADLTLLGDEEVAFLRRILEMGDVIANAATTLEPHKIAFYALELASAFHPLYDRVRALHGDVPLELAKPRLRFYQAAGVAFHRVLSLMGMNAPDRM